MNTYKKETGKKYGCFVPRNEFPSNRTDVYFGINIDIGEWRELCDDLEGKLPGWVRYLSNVDLQRYFRYDILGMTIP
jgi:hypothetical protein